MPRTSPPVEQARHLPLPLDQPPKPMTPSVAKLRKALDQLGVAVAQTLCYLPHRGRRLFLAGQDCLQRSAHRTDVEPPAGRRRAAGRIDQTGYLNPWPPGRRTKGLAGLVGEKTPRRRPEAIADLEQQCQGGYRQP